MAATPKFIQMIEHLVEATNRGKLRWKPADAERFVLVLGEVEISVEEDRDINYSVSLYKGGKILELEAFSHEENADQYKIVQSLWELARRSAFGVDAIIDQVIADVSARR